MSGYRDSFHQRTMEIFRSVGLQEEIESASAQEFVQNGAIVSVESLAGPEMKFFFRHLNEGVEALSPASRLFITQIGLEPLLRRSAQERGAEHAYATELISLCGGLDRVRTCDLFRVSKPPGTAVQTAVPAGRVGP